MKLILLYNDFVGEKPGGVACGTVPVGDCWQGDGLHTHVAGTAVERLCGKRFYLGDSKALWIFGMMGVDQMPLLPIF